MRLLIIALAVAIGGCGDDPIGCVSDAECASGLSCVAQRCRTVVRADGAVPNDGTSPECMVGGDACASGQECRPLGSSDGCGGAGAAGRCVALTGDPECGCDGWSYLDGTRRMAAHVAFAHDGFCTCAECATEGLCDVGYGCPDTEREGVCVERPMSCVGLGSTSPSWACSGPRMDAPSYASDCARLMAGADSAWPAPQSCSAEPAMPSACCRIDSECAGETRCYGSAGCATATGVCLTPPRGDECYGDVDCPPGYRCGGAPRATCASEPRSGRCELRTDGLR